MKCLGSLGGQNQIHHNKKIMKKYSFVVLTYNSRKTIEKCVQSIIDVKGDVEKEVIIVDNASSDDTVSYVKQRFGDQVILIENKDNKGFSGGVNDGLRRSGGDFCVLLNPDADVVTLDFAKVEKHFEDKKLGLLAPKVIYPDGRTQPSFGFYPTQLNLFLYFFKIAQHLPGGFLVYNNFWNKKYYTTKNEVDWASGAFMIIPKKVLEEIDYFDERYFLYVEDVDLCRRIKERGYSIVVDPEIEISHILQASVQQDPARNFDHQSQSFTYYFHKFHKTDISGFMNTIYSLKKKRVKKKQK